MKHRSLIHQWHDEISSFMTMWLATSFFIIFFDIWMHEPFGDFPDQNVLIGTTLAACILVFSGLFTQMLALSRQGRLSRHIPSLLGILAPGALVISSQVMRLDTWISNHPLVTLIMISVAVIVIGILSSRDGKRKLREILGHSQRLSSFQELERHDVLLRGKTVFKRAGEILSLWDTEGTWAHGYIQSKEAVIFTGEGSVHAVPNVVDQASKLALFMEMIMQKSVRSPKDLKETTAIFLTMIAIDLEKSGPFSDFDLRSKDRRDSEVVFDNELDRVEIFESSVFDQYHQLRISQSIVQSEAWQNFSPLVIDQLNNYPRINIRKQGSVLILYKIGGCWDSNEIDQMADLAQWLVDHLDKYTQLRS